MSPSGIVNTYYQGVGSLAFAATTLTLGAASGAAGTVTVGDKLIVMQMQGASIDTNTDERYGDGTGTAGVRPDTTVSQANGYTALNLAGGYEYVQVTAAAGNSIFISMRYVVASPCRAAALSAASRLISHRNGNGITQSRSRQH